MRSTTKELVCVVVVSVLQTPLSLTTTLGRGSGFPSALWGRCLHMMRSLLAADSPRELQEAAVVFVEGQLFKHRDAAGGAGPSVVSSQAIAPA